MIQPNRGSISYLSFVPHSLKNRRKISLQNVSEFHKASKIRYNGVQIPHLFPGEKFELKTPQHPTAAFASFEEAVLRYVSSGFNLTYEQLSRDYSKTNYSSARAAMLETWRFFQGRQKLIAGRFASVVYALWLEEAIDRGDIKLPASAPSFYDAKTAYCRADWIGPGRGHIDPAREADAERTWFQLGTTTQEEMCAAKGRDWREVARQRAQERKYIDSLGNEGDYERLASSGTPAAQPTEPADQADKADQAGERRQPSEQAA